MKQVSAKYCPRMGEMCSGVCPGCDAVSDSADARAAAEEGRGMRRRQNLEVDWERAPVCGAPHPHLPAENFCREVAGHAGAHLLHDERGWLRAMWMPDEPGWERSDVCGVTHPQLVAENFCREPIGHPGVHRTNDGCGQAEYVWTDEPAPVVSDSEVVARLAEMLVRCGIERGQLGRIDADNLARCLLPVVRQIVDREEQR